jgi:hypothetical protein
MLKLHNQQNYTINKITQSTKLHNQQNYTINKIII